ncbi:MAG: hypothetical protein K5876_08095 [Ruminiclostridium sp.]|nr:hypothetical protein [Ruminiclostridium sp.]
MFKEELNIAFESVRPSPELLDRVSAMMSEEAARKKPPLRMTAVKYAGIAAAVALAAGGTVMLFGSTDGGVKTAEAQLSASKSFAPDNSVSEQEMIQDIAEAAPAAEEAAPAAGEAAPAADEAAFAAEEVAPQAKEEAAEPEAPPAETQTTSAASTKEISDEAPSMKNTDAVDARIMSVEDSISEENEDFSDDRFEEADFAAAVAPNIDDYSGSAADADSLISITSINIFDTIPPELAALIDCNELNEWYGSFGENDGTIESYQNLYTFIKRFGISEETLRQALGDRLTEEQINALYSGTADDIRSAFGL